MALSTPSLRSVSVGGPVHMANGREAQLTDHGQLAITSASVIGPDGQHAYTMSTLAGGYRWLAADCDLSNGPPSGLPRDVRGSDVLWHKEHQLYCWPAHSVSPQLAPRHAAVASPLVLTVLGDGPQRVSLGRCLGYVHSPLLAVTGGRRTRSIVGLYDCDSKPGDCGSLVLSRDGVVGLHAGTLVIDGVRCNAYYPFLLGNAEPRVTHSQVESAQRQSGRQFPTVKAMVRRPTSSPLASKPKASKEAIKKKKADSSKREAGIVGMSAAPSDLPSRSSHASSPRVRAYVDVLMNPWAANPVRLPDHVVVPTAIARYCANRTYTIQNTAAYGGNFLYGLNTRMSLATPYSANSPLELSTVVDLGASSTAAQVYEYSPGNILLPQQWGAGGYSNPRVRMLNGSAATNPALGCWGDDFGSSMGASLDYVSAYRTLAAAIRVRIVGLPTGQFMTPGKIYFAQVRYDHTDLPVTEQDFVTLEQLGRASHVSADAVREAGSKTLFFTPDGSQKLGMTSNFLLPPGVFSQPQINSIPAPSGLATGIRKFPVPNSLTGGVDYTRAIVPYLSRGNDNNGTTAVGDALDSANADASSLLLVAYFGAADGVVLEVDYAMIAEYIPNKSTPGGVEALIQLPDSSALDDIYAAAAIMAEARPVLLQQPGDMTLVTPTRFGPGPTPEALRTRSSLSSFATRHRGTAYREGFWDFSWLKHGNVGPINWDFRDPPASASRARRR